MKFIYTKFTKLHYCEFSDEWEEDGVDFDYEPDNDDLAEAIVDLLCNDYELLDEENTRNALKFMIEDLDLVEEFAKRYEDHLKDIFKKEAFEYYED